MTSNVIEGHIRPPSCYEEVLLFLYNLTLADFILTFVLKDNFCPCFHCNSLGNFIEMNVDFRNGSRFLKLEDEAKWI